MQKVRGPILAVDIDLEDPNTHLQSDLNDTWKTIRDETPVGWRPKGEGGYWVVSRYEEAVKVYKDTECFTSIHGNVLETLMNGGDSAGGKMMAVSDGERHQQVRTALSRSFRPVALKRLATAIEKNAANRVKTAIDNVGCDFASDIAQHIPLDAICLMMGIDDEADKHKIHNFSQNALASRADTENTSANVVARQEILLFFARLLSNTESSDSDDLLSVLTTMKTEQPMLSDEEVLLNCYSLLVGGDETTRLTLIAMAKLFSDQPELWNRVRSGDYDERKLTEELLRWATPAIHVARTVTKDVMLGGVQLYEGDVVSVWNISANYDERRFDNPFIFNADRKSNPHLTFAYGDHVCLGAAVARMEIKATISALRKHVKDIHVLSEPDPIYSTFMRGYCSLPVSLSV